MLNKNILLTLLCIVAVVMAGNQLSFNVNQASYKKSQNYWTVDVPCNGGSSPYNYLYEALPNGWSSQGNSLNIPTSYTVNSDSSNAGNYYVRVIVSDRFGNSLRRTLLFKLSNTGLFVGQFDYNFSGASSASSGSYVNSQSSNSVNFVGTLTGSIGGLRTTSSTSSRTSVIPSQSELTTLINSGDTALISKIVQSVANSNLSCDQKLGFLTDLLGKLESFVLIKKIRIEDIASLIANSKDLIDRYTNQINQYLKSISELNIPGLKITQTDVVSRLNAAYSNYDSPDLNPLSLQTQSANYQTQWNNNNIELNKAQSLLNNDLNGSANITRVIADLQARLKAANDQKANYQARIISSRAFIATVTERNSVLKNKVQTLNTQIKELINKKNNFQNAYKTIEIEVQTIKSKVTATQAVQNDYLKRIQDLKDKINKQQPNLDDSQLKKLTDILKAFNDYIPILNRKIDQVQLKCAGVNTVQIDTTTYPDRLTFNPTQFGLYFTNVYNVPASLQPNIFGRSNGPNGGSTTFGSSTTFGNSGSSGSSGNFGNLGNLGNTGSVSLYTLNPLSADWTNAYGSSYTSVSIGRSGSGSGSFPGSSGSTSSKSTIGFRTTPQGVSATAGSYPSAVLNDYNGFNSDFSCSQTSNVSTNNGLISSIKGNVIRARGQDGNTYTLNLGTCSRLNTLVNSPIPKVGQRMYWKGQNTGGQNYNVHMGTCL